MGLLDKYPSLDDKTFDDLIKEARSLIPRYSSTWTDHNVHDPGITFMELFAWLAEMQIYRLNRVTHEQYLKFLKLVGAEPLEAQPAIVDISFEGVNNIWNLKAGEAVTANVGAENISFEIAENATLIPVKLQAIVTRYDTFAFDKKPSNDQDDISFYGFGKEAPAGATLELGFDGELPSGDQDLSIAFLLSEKDLPLPGSHGKEAASVIPSVTLTWEYFAGGTWAQLPLKKDTTNFFIKSGKIVFSIPKDMSKKEGSYWIRCRVKSGGYEMPPLLDRILLNTVSAHQVKSIENKKIGTGSGKPGLTIVFDEENSIIRECFEIEIRGNGKLEGWYQVEDFELSGPRDRHYIFDPERREITFGNGLNGRVPVEGHSIIASYKTTLGSKGNIAKQQTFHYKGLSGTNIREAAGGEDAESIEQAKDNAQRDLCVPHRAITSGDYEELALSTPGLRIARAKAIPDYNPDYPCIADFPGAVTVVVVPHVRKDGAIPIPKEGFIETVSMHLNTHRLVTTAAYVVSPEYVKLSVRCKIRVKERSGPSATVDRVKEALSEFLDPLKGGPDRNGWPFGRPVYPSEVYEVIDNVEGVEYATDVSLNGLQGGEIVAVSPRALVYPGEHTVETEQELS